MCVCHGLKCNFSHNESVPTGLKTLRLNACKFLYYKRRGQYFIIIIIIIIIIITVIIIVTIHTIIITIIIVFSESTI
jgi:hypothetical protein